MQEDKTEGIVLRCQEYKERQRIITLFSPQGVISLIVKGLSSKKLPLLALTTPFSHGEYHFIKKHSELLIFQDGVVFNAHLELRSSLQRLKTAGSLAQVILRSQWPGKASPALFALYKAYHQRVSCVNNWKVLLASFYLKVLKLEGVISFSKEDDQEHSLSDFFSLEEARFLADLEAVQKFSVLETVSVSYELLEKLEKLLHATV